MQHGSSSLLHVFIIIPGKINSEEKQLVGKYVVHVYVVLCTQMPQEDEGHWLLNLQVTINLANQCIIHTDNKRLIFLFSSDVTRGLTDIGCSIHIL